ncbi:MAG: pyridoxamine 5'-phosphate oxidase family protein [Pirellulaceae bacterium]
MTSEQERKEAITTLAEMINEIGVAMLTTVMPDGALRSRPMISAEPEFNGDLWFFTELDAGKIEEVQQNAQVNVSFASPHDQQYVSISGAAELVRDERKAEILWDANYSVWFPDDVDASQLGFLKVAVERAEYWDASTSRMVLIAGFAKAIFGGRHTQPEHGKIEWPEKQAATDEPQERE